MSDKKSIIKEILEWVYCILIALILALLIRYFVGTPTVVQQSSMYPTLKQGQRLILNRISRTIKETPNRGDIITFEAPSNARTANGATDVKAKYDNEPEGLWNKFTYYVLEIGKDSYIKRVIGLPGEHIEIKNGKIYINGEQLNEEEYLQDGVETEVQNANLADFVVPEGYIFAVGDNRNQSRDCRFFGCIPIEKIESKVWIRFWPFNLFGKVGKAEV